MSLQEASISIWLQFSDDTASLLSSFSDLSFFQRLSSLAETVVVVTPGSAQSIFAQGDGGGPLLRAELLVSTCNDKLITSNSISEDNWDWMDTGGGGGTRRLAKGSGWIRVNLDPGLDKDVVDEDFDFDISDTLGESDSDAYASRFDEDNGGNVSSNYYGKMREKMTNGKWNEVVNRGMVSQNNLERAVLMPSKEEGSMYIAPSQEKEAERSDDEKLGAQELELSMGAVLSLLCLSAFLFLANCLPCALRNSWEARAEEHGEEEDLEREAMGENERKTAEQSKKQEDVKQVDFIC